MKRSKYTFEYDEGIECLLDSTLAQMHKEIQATPESKYLEYLVLGGGYGRGEGGVYHRADGRTSLYNDLDFFVLSNTCLPWLKAKIDHFFQHYSKKWSDALKVEVDFSHARSVNYVRKRRSVLMWREMITGATLVYGDKAKFDRTFTPLPATIPPSEIRRLMVNRMSGLFMARQRLFRGNLSQTDYDFIARNINKVILACCDATLTAHNAYTFRTEDRLQNLQKLKLTDTSFFQSLLMAYEQAVQFKKNPQPLSDSTYYKEKCEQAIALCVQTLSLLTPFFATPESQSMVQRLKRIKNNYQLKKQFSLLGIKTSLAKDPLNSLLLVLLELLKIPEQTTCRKESTLLSIWHQLG